MVHIKVEAWEEWVVWVAALVSGEGMDLVGGVDFLLEAGLGTIECIGYLCPFGDLRIGLCTLVCSTCDCGTIILAL